MECVDVETNSPICGKGLSCGRSLVRAWGRDTNEMQIENNEKYIFYAILIERLTKLSFTILLYYLCAKRENGREKSEKSASQLITWRVCMTEIREVEIILNCFNYM